MAIRVILTEDESVLLKPKFASFLLALSMFVTGAAGLVYEYIMSTVSTYILGNSIEQFSVTIALMLFMMGLGSYLQKFVNEDYLIEKFIFLEVFISLVGGFAPIAIYAAFGTMEQHFNLVHYAFICSIGLMIGFEIPIVMRFNQKFSDTLKVNIAIIYGLDYLGSFVGALLWSYYLLRKFPLTEISFMFAGANIFVALITLGYFSQYEFVKKKNISWVAVLLSVIALMYGYGHNRDWNTILEQKLYEDPIVFSETTKYQRLVMTRRNDIQEYRFYINGNLQFSSADEAIYHEQLVHPVMSLTPNHKKVLILGGGDGMALREVLKYKNVELVTLVDLDSDMVRFCASDKTLRSLNKDSFADARVGVLKSGAVADSGIRPLYQESDKEKKAKNHKKSLPVIEKVGYVHVVNIDADKFVGEIKGVWNVIIVDFPDPNAIELAKLYSKEFYLKLRRILSEDGMIVIQSTSPYHAKEAYLCILRTVGAAGFLSMPYHDNVPSFGDWGWIMAWKSQLPKDLVEDRIAKMDISVETRYITPDVFKGSLNFGKGMLASRYDDVNTLMYPTLLDKYVRESWKIE